MSEKGGKTYLLTKSCLKTLAEKGSTTVGLQCLVQIIETQAGIDTEGRKKYLATLSDGVWKARGIIFSSSELAKFDVILIENPEITCLKDKKIFIIKTASKAFSNIASLIGSPVELTSPNPLEKNITPAIPPEAVFLIKESEISNTQHPNEGQFEEIKHKERVESMKGDSALVEQKLAAPTANFPSSMVQKENVSYRPLKALGPFSTDWTIKVKLTTKGEKKTFTKRNQEAGVLLPLTFADEEGTFISATLFGKGVEKYDEVLVEGKCYYITNGTIKNADPKYTSVKNIYTIILDDSCVIFLAKDEGNFNFKEFTFLPISKVKTLPLGTMVDVLGVVGNAGAVQSVTKKTESTSTDKKTILLFDESEESIEITFWRGLAQTKIEVGQIIGLKDLRLSEFANKKQLNSSGTTKVTYSPDDPRVESLKKIGSKVPSAPKGNIDSFVQIAEVADDKMVGECFFVGGFITFISPERNFSYNACASCKKKVEGEACANCGQKIFKPTYTFNMKLSDGTGLLWAHVFGEKGEQIFNLKAEELLALKAEDSKKFRNVLEDTKKKMLHYLIRKQESKYQGPELFSFEVIKIQPKGPKQENEFLLKKLRKYLFK